MHEINDTEHIVLSADTTLEFDAIQLHIGSASYDHYFDLIISDGLGEITFDQQYDIDFYLASSLLSQDQYVVERLDDGGLRVRFIPEPSSVTLSLLALAGLLTRRRRAAAERRF